MPAPINKRDARINIDCPKFNVPSHDDDQTEFVVLMEAGSLVKIGELGRINTDATKLCKKWFSMTLCLFMLTGRFVDDVGWLLTLLSLSFDCKSWMGFSSFKVYCCLFCGYLLPNVLIILLIVEGIWILSFITIFLISHGETTKRNPRNKIPVVCSRGFNLNLLFKKNIMSIIGSIPITVGRK